MGWLFVLLEGYCCFGAGHGDLTPSRVSLQVGSFMHGTCEHSFRWLQALLSTMLIRARERGRTSLEEFTHPEVMQDCAVLCMTCNIHLSFATSSLQLKQPLV